MPTQRHRRSWALLPREPLILLTLFFVLILAGCGKGAPTAADTDKQQARTALVAALDAWQAGKLSSLSAQNPPVTFSDDDVVQGHSLVSYELDPALVISPHTDVAVNLIIRDRAGKTQHRAATYQVTLSPTPTVIRNDP